MDGWMEWWCARAPIYLSSNAEGQQAIYGNNGSARGPKIQILRKGMIPIPKQSECPFVEALLFHFIYEKSQWELV